MGVSKTFNALGECTLYTADYVAFAQKIAEVFEVNVKMFFLPYIDEEDTEYEKPPELFDFGKDETYTLVVNFWKIDDSALLHPDNIYVDYELNIPYDYHVQNEMLLNFYQGGIIQLQFIPYESFWRFLIERITGKTRVENTTQLELIQDLINVRNLYIPIFHKLNCNQVVIWTDAYYKTEDKITKPNLSLKQIMKFMEEVDNIQLYNFLDVLHKKTVLISNNDMCHDVALIDNLDQEIEIESCLKIFN